MPGTAANIDAKINILPAQRYVSGENSPRFLATQQAIWCAIGDGARSARRCANAWSCGAVIFEDSRRTLETLTPR